MLETEDEISSLQATPTWTAKQRRTLAVARNTAPLVLRGLGATWRWQVPQGVPPGAFERPPAPAIYVFWHRCILPIAWYARGRGFGVLVSHHFDGEMVSQVAERLGYSLFRGSSTRGGQNALEDMTAALLAGRPLALTVDGPRGPCFKAKPGAIHLARMTGAPIYALHAAPVRCWTARSWDRMQVPKPFSRVHGSWDGPLMVPRDISPAEVEPWRVKMEEMLNRLRERVDRSATQGDAQ